MQNGPRIGHSQGRTSQGPHPQIGHRGVQQSDRDGASSVGAKPTYYRALVEGPIFNTTRGKGTAGGCCHNNNRSD